MKFCTRVLEAPFEPFPNGMCVFRHIELAVYIYIYMDVCVSPHRYIYIIILYIILYYIILYYIILYCIILYYIILYYIILLRSLYIIYYIYIFGLKGIPNSRQKNETHTHTSLTGRQGLMEHVQSISVYLRNNGVDFWSFVRKACVFCVVAL